MKSIKVKNISKKFEITEDWNRSSIFDILGISKRRKKDIWALKDVSFDVEDGEWLGIIGENGSGKSTLLKIISKVLYPTEGEVDINGNIASILSLDAGFIEELTAKENVYLYGSLMGLEKKYIDNVYDDIVNFSGLQGYMNTKYKKFSDGMKMRLAFATAMNVKADIIVSDEIFAVGDGEFESKCMRRMKEFKESGKTIVLVTHDLDIAREWCDRILLLDQGSVKDIGEPDEIIDKYSDLLVWKGNNEDIKSRNRNRIKKSDIIENIRFVEINGRENYIHNKNDSLHIVVISKQPLNDVQLKIRDKTSDKVKAIICNLKLERVNEMYKYSCECKHLFLEPNEYFVDVFSDAEKLIEDLKLVIRNSDKDIDRIYFVNPETSLDNVNKRIYMLSKTKCKKIDTRPNFIYKEDVEELYDDFKFGYIIENDNVTRNDMGADELIKIYKSSISAFNLNNELKVKNSNKLTQKNIKILVKKQSGEECYAFSVGERLKLEIELNKIYDKIEIVFRSGSKRHLSILSKKTSGFCLSFIPYLDPDRYSVDIYANNEILISDLKIEFIEGKRTFDKYIAFNDEELDISNLQVYAFSNDFINLKEKLNKSEPIVVYSRDVIDLDVIKDNFDKGYKIEGDFDA